MIVNSQTGVTYYDVENRGMTVRISAFNSVLQQYPLTVIITENAKQIYLFPTKNNKHQVSNKS